MKKTTIRKKIFLNSAIIIILAFIMILIGYLQFNRSIAFTEHILPLSEQTLKLEKFKGHFESFEHNLEEYFVTGGEVHEEKIYDDFDNLFLIIESLKVDGNNLKIIEKIESECQKLKKYTEQLLGKASLSTREQNELIILTYSKIKNIDTLHRAYSGGILNQLQRNVNAQKNSIRISISIFIFLGLVILVLYVVLGIILSRRISRPILQLKKATTEISKGNLDVKAKVKSADEIGELADSFNMMTSDLKESKEELEKRINQLERFTKLGIGREERVIELKKKIKEIEKQEGNKK